MADVSVVEAPNEIAPTVEYNDIAIENPIVNVSVVEDNVLVTVVQNEVTLSIANDKMDLEVIEQAVQVTVLEEGVTQIINNGEEEEVYDIEVDTSVSGVTYVGQALPGTAKATAAWRIKKITDSVGGSSVDWANGNAEFNKVWNDRLTYSYGP